MTTRFLVTGSAGFLGYHLANALARSGGNEVYCVDNFVRGGRDALYDALCARGNVTSFELDLTNRSSVELLPNDVDVIYHMAALNGTQNFYERPFEVVRSCTLPTLHLLERYGPIGRLKRFFYAGTSEAYASTVTRFGVPVPTSEDVPLCIDDVKNPRWSYGASKLHGEIATVHGCTEFGIPYSIGRYHNAYGPRMGDKHVIPDFITRCRRGIFALYGWEDTRSFIYVDDAVDATMTVCDSDACAGEVVNIGGAQEVTMLDLAKMIMEVCGLEGEIECHPSPAGSVRRRAPDLTKLKRLTGFEPRWSLEDGLKSAAQYYLDRQIDAP